MPFSRVRIASQPVALISRNYIRLIWGLSGLCGGQVARRRVDGALETDRNRVHQSHNIRTLTHCKQLAINQHAANVQGARLCSYCCRYNQWITSHRLTTIYGDFEHENPHSGANKSAGRNRSPNPIGEEGRSAWILQLATAYNKSFHQTPHGNLPRLSRSLLH